MSPVNDALPTLRFLRRADVYKAGRLAGHLDRASDGGVAFSYETDYLTAGLDPVASSLPLAADPVRMPSGGVPPFFAGLLPEGHRFTVVKNALKTSADDELSILMAVGADAPGDVQVLPAGERPVEPEPLVDLGQVETLDFSRLAQALDLHALPGVQEKASASMLTAPVAGHGARFILKLDLPEHPHLVSNEMLHLRAARRLKIPVAGARVVHDRDGRPGLLVDRFDRVPGKGDGWERLPVEDAAQVLGLPPAAKYTVTSEDVVMALASRCRAPLVAVRNLYIQFLFSWLTGNGDLHAKNVSVLETQATGVAVAPVYDIPSTLVYGDDSQALPVDGQTKNLRARHWEAFAEAIGLPEPARVSATALALRAADPVDLGELPLTGSPVNHAERELRRRRAELRG